MADNSKDFYKRLLETFKVEVAEHLKAISTGLLELEKNPPESQKQVLVENVMREAHSLKGASRAVNLFNAASVCQSFENVLSAVKKGEYTITQNGFDILHQSVDAIQTLASGDENLSSIEIENALGFIDELENLLKGESQPAEETEENIEKKSRQQEEIQEQPQPKLPEPKPEPAPPASLQTGNTVRIATAKLDGLLLKAEEMIYAKLMSRQKIEEIKEIRKDFLLWKKTISSFESGLKRKNGSTQNREALNFFANCKEQIKSIENKIDSLGKESMQDAFVLEGMVDSLLSDMKEVLLHPFSYLFDLLPKSVRELSRSLNKETKLEISGETIEVDRRILEELKAPLIHLVRNCIDHGIETPGERENKGKPRAGTIKIEAKQKGGNKIELLIEDDGKGISPDNVAASAVDNAYLTKAETAKLSDKEKLMLIFQSGISTSALITDISGRGLGLAIVKEKVEKLGGLLSINSEQDKGTKFVITLPLSYATVRGITVRISDRMFVIPTTNVEKVVRVNRDNIATVGNKETISIEGEAFSFVKLSEVLAINPGNDKDSKEKLIAVILGAAEKRVAFEVDEIISEQEVLIKGLGKQLVRVKNIAGATMLATGKVTPVLNVADLIKSSLNIESGKPEKRELPHEVKSTKPILIAEDSITARTLVKNIVESAGYKVKTAVDGLDALTTLKTEDYGLLVTDVDMPRMNGIELVRKVRADKKLSEIPVILVTSLASREDRERGIDAGANAYIVKSNFDQSNLLDAIRRLI